VRPWAWFGLALLAAPFDLLEQAAAAAQENVRPRSEGLAFDPAQHHRLMALGADGCVSAQAAKIWRGIAVHRGRPNVDDRETRNDLRRSVELPNFNLYPLQLFEFPAAYTVCRVDICTGYSFCSDVVDGRATESKKQPG
jgi:hypothetical protein